MTSKDRPAGNEGGRALCTAGSRGLREEATTQNEGLEV